MDDGINLGQVWRFKASGVEVLVLRDGVTFTYHCVYKCMCLEPGSLNYTVGDIGDYWISSEYCERVV